MLLTQMYVVNVDRVPRARAKIGKNLSQGGGSEVGPQHAEGISLGSATSDCAPVFRISPANLETSFERGKEGHEPSSEMRGHSEFLRDLVDKAPFHRIEELRLVPVDATRLLPRRLAQSRAQSEAHRPPHTVGGHHASRHLIRR